MFLTKLTIKNFLNISNEVTMDLTPNKNGIEEDIKEGKYRKIDNKIFSPITTISGKNGSGKTTLLKSISAAACLYSKKHMMFFLNVSKQPNFPEYSVIREFLINPNFKKTDTDERVCRDFLKDYKNFCLKEIFKIRKIGEETTIRLFFYDEKIKKEISLEVIANNEIIFNYYLENEITKDEKIIEKIENIKDNIFLANNVNGFTTIFPHEIENRVNEMINTIGKENTKNLLEIVDFNIVDIIIPDNKEPFSFITMNGAKLFATDLSSGTKKMIFLLPLILKSMLTNKSSIFLIDEIENELHNDLVTFIKNIFLYSEANIQLIFTSHNPFALSECVSYKQIFCLKTKMNGETELKRASSSDIKPHENFVKKHSNGKVSSHPPHNEINEFLQKIIRKDFSRE